MTYLIQYEFLRNAVLAGVFASVVCGIIGVIVVEKKMVMLTGGIAHTSYGGIGLGCLAGFPPMLGALLAAVLAAFGIGWLRRKNGADADVVIGLFWSLGMALGILFIGMTPGYPPNVESYLFGNILSVTRLDLLAIGGFSLVTILLFAIGYSAWQAYLFDDEFAQLNGLKTTLLENVLLVLIAVAVVVLVRVVGIILVLALFTAPAAVASLLSNRLHIRIMIAVLAGGVFCLAGLALSYALDVPAGAMIVLLAAAGYFFTSIVSHKAIHRKEASHEH